jgi:hypothetical protein
MQERAMHDAENGEDGGQDAPELIDEEEGPGYPVLAALARTRLAALPQPCRPKGVVVSEHGADAQEAMQVLQQLAHLAAGSGGPSVVGLDFPRPGGRSRRSFRRSGTRPPAQHRCTSSR